MNLEPQINTDRHRLGKNAGVCVECGRDVGWRSVGDRCGKCEFIYAKEKDREFGLDKPVSNISLAGGSVEKELKFSQELREKTLGSGISRELKKGERESKPKVKQKRGGKMDAELDKTRARDRERIKVRVKEMYAQGLPYKEIAYILNKEGFQKRDGQPHDLQSVNSFIYVMRRQGILPPKRRDFVESGKDKVAQDEEFTVVVKFDIPEELIGLIKWIIDHGEH